MTLLANAQHEDGTRSTGRRMGRWVNKVLGVNYQQFCPTEAWDPAINLYEDAKQYYVIVDLAGVRAEQIDIRVDEKGMLLLAGKREAPEVPHPAGSIRFHLMEIDHGQFCRTVDLPEDADIDKIDAAYKTGLLWIKVPKKA